jgi:hypothetical protein
VASTLIEPQCCWQCFRNMFGPMVHPTCHAVSDAHDVTAGDPNGFARASARALSRL